MKEDVEIPKAALLWYPQGSRKTGRPRNSWRRSVIKETGRSWNELRFLAADRQKWKGLIDNVCSQGTMDSIILYIYCATYYFVLCTFGSILTISISNSFFNLIWIACIKVNKLINKYRMYCCTSNQDGSFTCYTELLSNKSVNQKLN